MKHYYLFLLWICCIACSSNDAEKKSYETQKINIAETEEKDAIDFIVVKGESKKHLLGRTVVRGTLQNKASVCSYKNCRVKQIAFADDKKVEEHEDVIEMVIAPGTKVNFKTRYKLPKGTDSVALSIMKVDIASCITE